MSPSRFRPAMPLAALALVLLISGCATTSGPKEARVAKREAPRGRSGDMVSAEESGLGITGAETPPALKIIAAAPYAVPPAVDCAALAREIAGLDELLGPDVDILADPKARARLDDRAGRAVGSALRGAIPYRWAIRWLTQAGALDKQLRQAVMAGAARRGFLKGMRLLMACPAQAPPLLLLAPAGPGGKDAATARPTSPAEVHPGDRRVGPAGR